jgi:hypothetical protein
MIKFDCQSVKCSSCLLTPVTAALFPNFASWRLRFLQPRFFNAVRQSVTSVKLPRLTARRCLPFCCRLSVATARSKCKGVSIGIGHLLFNQTTAADAMLLIADVVSVTINVKVTVSKLPTFDKGLELTLVDCNDSPASISVGVDLGRSASETNHVFLQSCDVRMPHYSPAG